jgi:hypothetical protein
MLVAVQAGRREILNLVTAAVPLRLSMFDRCPRRTFTREQALAVAAAKLLQLRQLMPYPARSFACERHRRSG